MLVNLIFDFTSYKNPAYKFFPLFNIKSNLTSDNLLYKSGFESLIFISSQCNPRMKCLD